MKNIHNNYYNDNNKNHEFYRFYGKKAYNYYTIRALNLKFPNATSEDFMKIINTLISENFLTEIAKVCNLDEILTIDFNPDVNVGEMLEVYCSGMLFNEMEEEMKKFTSDVVDYYFAKEENIVNVEEVKNNQLTIKEKESVAEEKDIPNEVVEEVKINNKDQSKGIKKYKKKAYYNRAPKVDKKLKKRNLLTEI
ncbi:hypothetical protein C1645_854139 [Glomus cerebriforme]|uniref:RNase III domain-containing protein n=1 Tax=Glomus cerebriforme TaxID=658196 RepID=A0A397THL2_9GLOM|nr:hypothetical protein C1645_854139 [Glomus cerebriforme]